MESTQLPVGRGSPDEVGDVPHEGQGVSSCLLCFGNEEVPLDCLGGCTPPRRSASCSLNLVCEVGRAPIPLSLQQVRKEKPGWIHDQELNLMLQTKNKLDTELYEFAKQHFTHYASSKLTQCTELPRGTLLGTRSIYFNLQPPNLGQ